LPDIQGVFGALRQRVAEWAASTVTAGWNAFLPFLPSLVATAVLLVLIVGAGIAIRIRRDRVFHGATLPSIDAMDGTQFEEFLSVLFAHLGYRVQHVGMSHDFGADLVLTSRRQPCSTTGARVAWSSRAAGLRSPPESWQPGRGSNCGTDNDLQPPWRERWAEVVQSGGNLPTMFMRSDP
jgi:hypothetical protein